MSDDATIRIGAKNNARKVIAGVKQDLLGIQSTTKKVTSAIGGLLAPGALLGIGGGLTLSSAIHGVADAMQRIDDTAKTARRIGIMTEELVGLRLAASELSGMAGSQVDMALQRMTRRIAEAAQGAGEAKAVIAELNLDAQRLVHMDPGAAFREIADAIREVDNESDQLRIAFKLFDSEGAGLVNTLRAGSSALEDFKQQAKDLGMVLSTETEAAVERANDKIGRLMIRVNALKLTLAGALATPLGGAADDLTTATTGTRAGGGFFRIFGGGPNAFGLSRFFETLRAGGLEGLQKKAFQSVVRIAADDLASSLSPTPDATLSLSAGMTQKAYLKEMAEAAIKASEDAGGAGGGLGDLRRTVRGALFGQETRLLTRGGPRPEVEVIQEQKLTNRKVDKTNEKLDLNNELLQEMVGKIQGPGVQVGRGRR